MKQEIEEKELTEHLHIVSFKIGDEEYGVDILNVQEINKMTAITKVPNSPVFVEGVINLRGRIIPVIDFRTRLKLSRKAHDKETRIIIVEFDGITLGFIVDSVSEVLRIPVDIVEAPPSIIAGIDSDFIKSVGKLEDRLLILIDLKKVLFVDDKNNLKEVA
ncbi:MAG: chemotaxis protein CheW [Ignavibacteriae bacterium HGW-Ignavibacteriae-3]|nr:MAG: chemotaxis protein CheW [Ignavibacteriae bacterium HGW-Ignavibacteriae-3]